MINTFVFDTNTLISAHLIKNSVPRLALNIALEKGLVIQSNETLKEFAETFIKPKFDRYISLQSRMQAISEFEKRTVEIKVIENLKFCRDTKDDKFLSLALSALSDYIITGDKDLLVLHPFRNIPILSPADFIQQFK
jgi:putative PIN family toxin of toxin-antitoxin system